MCATHQGNDHKERVNSNFLATMRIDVRPINACAFPFLPQYVLNQFWEDYKKMTGKHIHLHVQSSLGFQLRP